MPNPQKQKGDEAEREAVAAIRDLAPDLVVWNAQRMLGAGRKEDVGDLLVFDDVAVQVKSFKAAYLSAAIYQAATGATVQAGHGRKRFALGLILVPRARKVGAVRFAAVVEKWPAPGEHAPFSSAVAALDAVKAAGPDSDFTARVVRKGQPEIVLSSLQNWVRVYRVARESAAS